MSDAEELRRYMGQPENAEGLGEILIDYSQDLKDLGLG